MTKIQLILLLCFFVQASVSAQVKIGDNPNTINGASLLELETTNKGFVFPRVSLTSVSSATPLPAGLLTGTVVYNTNASVTGGNGTGLYIWGGAAWTSVTSSGGGGSNSWIITGNNNVSSSNFLGTTDPNVPLIFKVGGVQAGFLGISSSGITTFGVGATAGSQQSTALGTGATATGQNSTALGAGASAGSQQSTALGTGATASDAASLAVGYNAKVSSQNAIAIGSNANTSVTGGIALGFGAIANSQNGVAIGSNAGATTNPNTLALGTGTKATGQNSIAVGNSASAPNIGSEAFGNSAAATGANSMVVGNNSISSGDGAISIGDQATAAGTNSIVLGNNSSVGAGTSSAIVIGDNLTTSQSNVLILGNSSKTVGISTTTPNPAAKLDVNGPFKLGTNGTVIDNLIKTTFTTDSSIIISENGTISITITRVGARRGATVIVNPRSRDPRTLALPNHVAIAYTYVSAINTVTIDFISNDNVLETIPAGTTFDITIIQ
jgi:trimeric autotransporter adhesin